MGYFINDIDLSTFGISVEKLTGFEVFPKRKGDSYYSFPDANGVDPFLEDGEIFFESRDITLDVHFIAATVQIAQTNMIAFFDLLKSSGFKDLKVDYLGRVFCTFFTDGSQAKRIGSVGGSVAYSMALKLKEVDPTITNSFESIDDFDDELFVDFDLTQFYILT
jgi:hypothetical protein